MVYGVITGIIFGVLLVGCFGLCIAAYVNDWHKATTISFGVGIAVFFSLFLCIPFSFHTVDTGEIAVVKHLGQIKEVRTAGTYFDFWMTDKYQRYDAKVQNCDITTQAYSKDAQQMDILMTIQFQIQSDNVRNIAIQYGELDALENRIQNVVIERTKSVLAKYSAMEIIETRATISPEVEEVVKNAIDDSYYVSVTTVVLYNIDFSDVFEQTVEDKMVAEQKKLQAQYEKERAIIQAEQELEVAKLEAQAMIEKAQGNAEAQKVFANAAAYAAQIKIVELARTLGYIVNEEEIIEEDKIIGIKYSIEWNDDNEGKQAVLNYLKYLEWLSTWNGELPDVVAGDNLSLFIPAQS